MRKFVIGILSLLTLLTAIAILVVRRKETQESKCSKTYTQETEMRDVENPFEEIVAQPEGEPMEVVVKLKDYDWREVYKNDILTIIGIGVVVILVVVVSVFSNMSRVAFDTTEREEKKSVETTVIQSVSTLEQSIVGIAERVDSLDAHFMEETTMLKKMIKPTVNAKHGERKKK